jgi:hypothetical protein
MMLDAAGSPLWGWALGFALGVFVTLFVIVAFDIRLFRGSRDPIRGAIARRLAMGPSIVAVGGGTGLSTLLKGIKAFGRGAPQLDDVTVVVLAISE